MLGDILKELRKRSGVTIEEIRKTLRISKLTYYNWEEEKSLPREEQINKLADLFASKLPAGKAEDIKLMLVNAMKADLEKALGLKSSPPEKKPPLRKPAKNLATDFYLKKVNVGLLSEKTGISTERISDFLVGLSSPTLEEAEKLAEFFGTSPERYLDFVDEEVLQAVLTKNKRLRNVFTRILELEDSKRQVLLEIVEKLLSLEKE